MKTTAGKFRVIMLKQKNSKKQGDVGLACSIFMLGKLGYTVSIPLTDSQDYDLIVEIDSKLCKVQVKTSRYKEHGNYVVSLRTNGGNMTGAKKAKKMNKQYIDYLFVLVEDGTCYFIPSCEIVGDSSITLYKGYEEFIIK